MCFPIGNAPLLFEAFAVRFGRQIFFGGGRLIVKVCDALCGSGKTVSCINMINENTDKRYIFITPYLEEVERIKARCVSRHFVSPERKYVNGYSKLNDIHNLLRNGYNIASTHALFSCYTEETKELIRERGYTLVLDEVIDLFQPVNLDAGDIKMLLRKNIAQRKDHEILWDDDEYDGVLFSEIMQMSKSRNLIDYDGTFFFWAVPVDVFQCFQDAYVLTYLFEYQMQKYFFDIHKITYELIGTRRENDTYRFCRLEEMNRRIDLRDTIHILHNERMNRIGAANFSLSAGWYERKSQEPGKPKICELKNNLYNVFRHIFKSVPEKKMWTTLNKYRSSLRGKGYSNGFVSFNKRATNDYIDRKYLAYCVNVFMQPWVKNYLIKLGAKDIDQDMYALSVLVQWIFRSAIRKGEDVWLYLPSKRMRYLLEQWLDNLALGKDLESIRYIGRKSDIGNIVVKERTMNKKKGESEISEEL